MIFAKLLVGNCIMLYLIKTKLRPFREEACGLHNGYLIPRCSIRSSRLSFRSVRENARRYGDLFMYRENSVEQAEVGQVSRRDIAILTAANDTFINLLVY